jgi:NAD(P)-dependent dehydrogenase (short-subunit alcohol dehydrogenase family)
MTATPPRASDPAAALRLDGRVALVTGAGRGLGEGCARALASLGAEVIVMSRTAKELDALVAAIRAEGGKARALVCDVTDTASVDAAFAAIERLDILVNNAGGNQPQHFLEVADDVLDRLIDLNIRAAFVVAQRAARIMARAKSGVIVNMSSQMGHVGGPNRTVYCASKHAIEGLTKAMAIDLAPLGIRAVSVAPTFVETPLTQPFLADKTFKDFVIGSIPMGRTASVADIANAVAFAASPAAGLITGTSLVVDGGWTAR